MQKIFLIGFVGRDPEEKFTSGGKKVTSFPIGINSSKKEDAKTSWYKIACWESQCASILPFIKKGSCISVIGDLQTPSLYQTKKGEPGIDLSVSAHSISFMPSSKKEEKKDDESVFTI